VTPGEGYCLEPAVKLSERRDVRCSAAWIICRGFCAYRTSEGRVASRRERRKFALCRREFLARGGWPRNLVQSRSRSYDSSGGSKPFYDYCRIIRKCVPHAFALPRTYDLYECLCGSTLSLPSPDAAVIRPRFPRCPLSG